MFLFYNNKLVGVVTYFRSNILPELIEKYGNGFSGKPPILSKDSRDDIQLWANRHRFLIWEHKASLYSFWETITYIDGTWIQNICKLRIEEYRKNRDRTRSKID
jgi:hypothetical protein